MRTRAFASLAFFACCLGSTVARAQMSEGERKAAARAAYGEGIELQDKGKPGEALGRFEAAEKLFDAPTHLLHIAQCQSLTGKLVEASETYETLQHKSMPPGSPDAFVQAQETGKAELAALHPRIPTLRVLVKPDPQKLPNLQITLNDRQMPVELVGIARPINPGPYRLSASATGWATPTLATVDVSEAETKTVELTLQQGAVAAVVVPPPPPSQAPSPPPYEANQPPPKPGPSSTGLLVGGHVGLVVPAGDADKARPMQNVASAGPGFGVDLLARVAKVVLVGGTLDIAPLGAPSTQAIPLGTKADISTTSVYFGILLGILPRVDRISFVGDLGLGYRVLSENTTITAPVPSPKSTIEYGGGEIGLDAGVSFPAGPVRIVPKAGVQIGSFGSRSCTGDTSPCASAVDTSAHSVLTVSLTLYYDVDLGKKSGSAAAFRGPGLL